MRSGVALSFGLALTLLAGCGRASPVSPAGTVDGDQGDGTQARVLANLALTDVSVRVSRADQLGRLYWAYSPRFRIIETSGRTGAVIKAVVVKAPFPVTPPDTYWEETGELCWRSEVRVEAGGTLHAFAVEPYSPGGLYYCAPFLSSLAAEGLPSVVVTVIYVDDYGATGEVVASIPVAPD